MFSGTRLIVSFFFFFLITLYKLPSKESLALVYALFSLENIIAKSIIKGNAELTMVFLDDALFFFVFSTLHFYYFCCFVFPLTLVIIQIDQLSLRGRKRETKERRLCSWECVSTNFRKLGKTTGVR